MLGWDGLQLRILRWMLQQTCNQITSCWILLQRITLILPALLRKP